jgi:putative transposase
MGYSYQMPWKDTCAMNEREKFIQRYKEGEESISELARQFDISRKTAHKWIERVEEEGQAGLQERSRAPHHHPNALSEAMEQRILEWKARKPLWGAPKIHAKLWEMADCPSESTVSNVLARYGLVRKARRRHYATASLSPFADCQEVNQVWCADFKGHFRTGDGTRCDPLTISDAHSRYLLRCQALRGTTGVVAVLPLFVATFREYGMPQAIRTDNGAPFASTGLGGLSPLSVWWIRLGIGLERIQPGHPQENGRHERMHRTLREAAVNPPCATFPKQQQAFVAFRTEFNEERPHEALGQKPPASLYVPSSRDYPERLPEQQGYPDDWEKRIVREGGRMKWKGQQVHINRALWGQEIGFKPIGEARWAVYFESLELGLFDERKGRVRRLENLSWTLPL